MPPSNQAPFDLTSHLLPPAHKSSVGPIIGIIIIVMLLIVGALYFWGAHLNARDDPENNLPLILGDPATIQ